MQQDPQTTVAEVEVEDDREPFATNARLLIASATLFGVLRLLEVTLTLLHLTVYRDPADWESGLLRSLVEFRDITLVGVSVLFYGTIVLLLGWLWGLGDWFEQSVWRPTRPTTPLARVPRAWCELDRGATGDEARVSDGRRQEPCVRDHLDDVVRPVLDPRSVRRRGWARFAQLQRPVSLRWTADLRDNERLRARGLGVPLPPRAAAGVAEGHCSGLRLVAPHTESDRLSRPHSTRFLRLGSCRSSTTAALPLLGLLPMALG